MQEKVLSCGVILTDKEENMLIVRPTNGQKWDIPKGLFSYKNDKSYWRAAKRECLEETGIDLDKISHKKEDLGCHYYYNLKDLYLFRITVNSLPEIKGMHCSSTFWNDEKKLRQPEVDRFKYVPVKDYIFYLGSPLKRLFDKIYPHYRWIHD